jgi:acyl-CoA reductase-like NAD-dependent aldehyde dehydrogenase
MATNFESSFELLRAAAIDGRTTNIRYRQNELQSLHAALRNDAESICAAIQNDWQSSGANAESEAEYYLAMDAVAHFYEVLDFDKALKDEYMISTGEDNPNRRVGKGVVVIRPTNHTRFYSVICPLAAAIAAGNCVCLEVRTLDRLDLIQANLE